MYLACRVINGFMVGILGFLVINESTKIRKLNNIEKLLSCISDNVKDIGGYLEQKDFNENFKSNINKETQLSTSFLQEEINEETGEVNPNLIYDDDTEEKSSESSSDGWKEVRTDSENNSEEKNDGCDNDETEKTKD